MKAPTTRPAQGTALTDIWGSGDDATSGALKVRAVVASRPTLAILVSKPPSASSYNPKFEDHQKALAHSIDIEETEFKRRQEARNKTLPFRSEKMPPAQRAKEADARRAIIEAEEENDGEGEEEEEEEEEKEETEREARVPKDKLSTSVSKSETFLSRPGEKGETIVLNAAQKKAARAAARRRKIVERKAERLEAERRSLEVGMAALESEDARRRESAGAEKQPKKKSTTASLPAPLLEIPLSNELSGSLRTMIPISASQLLLPVMQSLVARKDAGGRSRASPAVTLVEAAVDGGISALPTVVTQTDSQIRHSRGNVGKRYKVIEFPRNKNFAPAEEAVREALARGEIRGGQVPGLLPDFKAQAEIKKRLALGGSGSAMAGILSSVPV